MLFHPNGRYVYAGNELDGTVDIYRFDPDHGTLTLRHSDSGICPEWHHFPWTFRPATRGMCWDTIHPVLGSE